MTITERDILAGKSQVARKAVAIFRYTAIDILHVGVVAGTLGFVGLVMLLLVPHNSQPGEDAAVVAVPLMIAFLFFRLLRIALPPLSESELTEARSATEAIDWLVVAVSVVLFLIFIGVCCTGSYWLIGATWAYDLARRITWVLFVILLCLGAAILQRMCSRWTDAAVMRLFRFFMYLPGLCGRRLKTALVHVVAAHKLP